MMFMPNMTRLLTVVTLSTAAALASAQPMKTSHTPTNQTVHHFEFQKTERARVNYLLFLPEGYDAKGAKRWPLMLFLHGAGERGTNIWKVATHGPPKNVATQPDFPFIVVSPQCPEHQTWSRDALLGLLDDVMAKYAVDTKRVYLTGLSMGGYGTWDLGLAYPERFAAIVPICGGGQTITVLAASREKGAALKTLGVWAFHGGKDPVVPLAESQRMVDAVKKAGVTDVHLTVYPEALHNSWTETYKNPKLYEWLLKHER
jgi:predicted peptidase